MWPPPMAYPATMATTGLGMRRIRICRSSTLSRPIPRWATASSPMYPSSPRIRWSPPEQKASGPSPHRTITPTSGSSRATVKASVSSKRVWGRKALRRSGRQMVSLAIPSATS